MPLSKRIFFASSSQSSRAFCTAQSLVNESGAASSSEAKTSSPAGETSRRNEAIAPGAKSSQARAIARVSAKSADATPTN